MSKLTKEERKQREHSLTAAIMAGLIATTEDAAERWANVARNLRQGLTPAAVDRAWTRGRKLAEEHAPGFIAASDAMDDFERICKRRKISKRDRDEIWGCIAQFCMFQLNARSGPFYDAARYFCLAAPSQPGGEPIRVVRGSRTPGCDCPSCRPRAESELN